MSKRLYYRLMLETDSPLSIGGADSERTDCDIVLDSRGLPLLPATSVAGVLRSLLDKDAAMNVFGYINGEWQQESAIRIYDFTHCGGNEAVSVRDNVALENRVAKPGAKFDRLVAERGARFKGFIEITDIDRCAESDIEQLLGKMASGEVAFGSKTTRGFGRVLVKECKRLQFDLPVDRSAWLDFDMFDDEAWLSADNLDFADAAYSGLVLSMGLSQRGAISVREYYTTPQQADFGQMVGRVVESGVSREGEPIVPGTTWAGAFRDRFIEFSSREETERLFGFVSQTDNSQKKSSVFFSESILSGGEWKEVTRNSIDRFTGGTKDGALFTELAYFGGTTELVIRVEAAALANGAQTIAPLLAAVADLHNGFLSVGGLVAVGHGLFRIESANLTVNGQNVGQFAELFFNEVGDGLIQPDINGIITAIDSVREGDDAR